MPQEGTPINQSKMQAMFVANSTLKRNRRYFDI